MSLVEESKQFSRPTRVAHFSPWKTLIDLLPTMHFTRKVLSQMPVLLASISQLRMEIFIVSALKFLTDFIILLSNSTANWGTSQPGCLTSVCGHERSNFFYAESILSDGFVANRCSGWDSIVNRSCPPGQGTAVMGGDAAKPGAHGVFFLATNAESPFAQG